MHEHNDRPMFDGNFYARESAPDLIEMAKDAVSTLFEPKLDHGYIHVISHQVGSASKHDSSTYLYTDAPGNFIYQVKTRTHSVSVEAEVVIFKNVDEIVKVYPL